MTHVLVTAPFPEHLLDKIRAVSPEVRLEQVQLADRKWPSERTTAPKSCMLSTPCRRPEQAPNLRWVQTHWAGIDHLREHSLWNSDILVTNASGIHAPNIAQYVMAQILSWAHRTPRWFYYQQRGEWPRGAGRSSCRTSCAGRRWVLLATAVSAAKWPGWRAASACAFWRPNGMRGGLRMPSTA
jgi:phosphoglycerate dehydrogenase-like enzyme